ncbi:hypothetical protein SALB1_1484 [Salinisphaera sp. LB1]|nr:hypothetical protein SALB1_1484 [Salinisphaera sp. LB1]
MDRKNAHEDEILCYDATPACPGAQRGQSSVVQRPEPAMGGL